MPVKVRARPALANFTRHMELVLRKNDYKHGWSYLSTRELLSMLQGEVLELAAAKNNDDRRKECCDIANFAMMIFDNLDRSSKG